EGRRLRRGGDGLLDGRDLSVVLEELNDGDAGRDAKEVLLDAQQEVVHLARLRLGLLARNFAKREGVLLAEVAEENPEAAVSFLKCCHVVLLLVGQRDGNITATLLPKCYQGARA